MGYFTDKHRFVELEWWIFPLRDFLIRPTFLINYTLSPAVFWPARRPVPITIYNNSLFIWLQLNNLNHEVHYSFRPWNILEFQDWTEWLEIDHNNVDLKSAEKAVMFCSIIGLFYLLTHLLVYKTSMRIKSKSIFIKLERVTHFLYHQHKFSMADLPPPQPYSWIKSLDIKLSEKFQNIFFNELILTPKTRLRFYSILYENFLGFR